ncbi:MAG TPA: hypothetical protein VJ719_03795 [Chthoniobacterales bacterium]|nr:hypothetical protein [Chthoniobacterales bacterium]
MAGIMAALVAVSSLSAGVIESYDPDGMPGDFDPNDGTHFDNSGSFFDLMAINKVNITAFDVFSNTTEGEEDYSFSIYYRLGTYEGFQTNSAGWMLLQSFTGPNAPDDINHLTLTTPFMINPGQTIGFLVASEGGFQWYDSDKGQNVNDGNLNYTVHPSSNTSPTLANGYKDAFGPFDSEANYDAFISFAGRIYYDTPVAAVPEGGAALGLLSIGLMGLFGFRRIR